MERFATSLPDCGACPCPRVFDMLLLRCETSVPKVVQWAMAQTRLRIEFMQTGTTVNNCYSGSCAKSSSYRPAKERLSRQDPSLQSPVSMACCQSSLNTWYVTVTSFKIKSVALGTKFHFLSAGSLQFIFGAAVVVSGVYSGRVG